MKDFSAIAVAPRDAQSSGQELLPHKKSTPNFVIVCHPKGWECVETDRGWEWLPRLKCLYERAGVNGVREVFNDRGDAAGISSVLTRAKMRESGWIEIPRDFCPAEVMAFDDPVLPGKGYVVGYRAIGGTVHLCRWDKPVFDNNEFETKTNHAQKWAFQRALIAAKLVAQPSDTVIEREMRIKRRRVGRNEKNAHMPTYAHRAAVAKADLQGMETASARQKVGEPLTMASLPSEIRARLDALGIAYEPSEPKKKLLAKIEAHLAQEGAA